MNKNSLIAAAVAAALAAPAAGAAPEPQGRIHLDYAFHDADVTPLDDSLFVRRARLGLSGEHDDLWSYKAEADFAENSVAWKDLYLRYSGLGGGNLTIGQVKVPFGFDELTSSNNITFIERASPMAFALAHRTGVQWGRSFGDSTLTVMGFGQEVGAGAGGDEGTGFAARWTMAPYKTDTSVLHVGLAGITYETENSNETTMRFRQRPEARPAGTRLVDTGAISDADGATVLGFEAAWQSGPFSVQGEYITNTVDRGAGFADPTFDGYYVAASWFPSGHNRRYSRGSFSGPRLADGGPAAWELAVRYSNLNLDDAGITGGEMNNLTAGVNWYPRSNVRFMFNYIMVGTERGGVDDDPNILLVRAQVSF